MKVRIHARLSMEFIEVPPKMVKKMEKLFKKMESKDCKVNIEVDDE